MDAASLGTTASEGMRRYDTHTAAAGPDVSVMSATRSGHLPNAPVVGRERSERTHQQEVRK